MAVSASISMESPLSLLVEAFLPRVKMSRPAEPKVSGTGSPNFASLSLEVAVVVPLPFLPFDSWTGEYWIWEKQHLLLDVNSEHMQIPGESCPSSAKCGLLAGIATESSKGHSTVGSGQLLQDGEDCGKSS